MLRKKPWRDPYLALAVLLSLLRADLDDYIMRSPLGSHLPEIHDILLGPSAALTETQFHNLYNTYDGGRPGAKQEGLGPDWLPHDLHSLAPDFRPAGRGRTEIAAWLLDRLEPNNARSLPLVNVAAPPNNNNNNDENNNNGEASEGGATGPVQNTLDGAVAVTHGIPNNEDLTPEDMDLIETLWRQDIDMGISREESYVFKDDLLLEKAGEHPDKLKAAQQQQHQQQHQSWENFGYNIDGETGEYVPNPPGLNMAQSHTPQPTLPQVPVQPDGNISLEDCLQLLEDEYLPSAAASSSSAPNPPAEEQYQGPSPQQERQPLSPQEQEQRWRDLASIPELTHQLHELPGLPYHQAALDMSNITQAHSVQDAFAINATTNGNVNLQNATLAPAAAGGNLLPPVVDGQRLGGVEFGPQPEVFSPLSNFANLSLSSASPTGLMGGGPGSGGSGSSGPNPHPQAMNFSGFLLPEHGLQPSLEQALPGALEGQDNSSLLMELLNASNVDEVDPMDLDFDEQMHSVMQAFGETNSSTSFEGSCSGFEEMSDGSSPYNTSDDGLEGATGYNASLDGHGLNGTSGNCGYHRQRGGSSCGGDSDSGSSFSSYNSQQSSKPENVKHNHTYAASSSSSSGGGNRSSNSSKSGPAKKDKQGGASKLSRDEKRARALKVPVPIDKIIGLPVDAFNDMLKKYELNDAQLTLIRDIRRRGKNKVAAQNCRKRKINALVSVEVNIDHLREEKEQLRLEREHIDKETSEMQSRYDQLYREVFQSMCDEHGDPVDPNEFTLQQMPDGSMFLVPRNGTAPDKDKDGEK